MPEQHPYASSLPAPPTPDLGEPEVFRSPTGHVVLFMYPWADDDHDLVARSMSQLIDSLHRMFPQPGDAR